MQEKIATVSTGGNATASPRNPTPQLIAPINTNKDRYRGPVVFARKVQRALAKNEKVTATKNPAKLLDGWSSEK